MPTELNLLNFNILKSKINVLKVDSLLFRLVYLRYRGSWVNMASFAGIFVISLITRILIRETSR